MKVRNLFIGLVAVLAWLMSGCGGNSPTQPGPPGTQFPADISGTYTFTLVGTGGSLTLQGTLKQGQWTPCNGNLLCNGATFQNDLSGNFSFPWCSPDSFTATGQLFFTPGNPETFAFAIFDNTVSSNLLIINSADFSKRSGTWEEGTAFTCMPIPSGSLTWTAVKK
jgi:hypothetical protein